MHVKNLIFCFKTELKTKHPKNTFFDLILHNLWFRSAKLKFFRGIRSQFFATYGSASVKLKISGLHTLHVHMKHLILCLKTELKTKHSKNTFFELFFRNLWFRLSQTEFLGGSEAKKVVKNMFFLCAFVLTS